MLIQCQYCLTKINCRCCSTLLISGVYSCSLRAVDSNTEESYEIKTNFCSVSLIIAEDKKVGDANDEKR